MEYEQLERIVRAMQSLAGEAKVKRDKFAKNRQLEVVEQAMGESVGIGKCLGVLVEEFPEEMERITAVTN